MFEDDLSSPAVEVVPVRITKSAVRVKAKPAKRMTFDVYARRRALKKTHISGMRAFTKNPNIPRTLAEWDEFFKSY